jgi:hypothetical protein
MRIPTPILVAVLILIAPVGAMAAGLPPWQFGMTKEQVTSFKQFGPYKSFRNGDLETYNGIYRGHKENVQFFFVNNRLVRIGVYLWEGRDPRQGISAWRRVYDIFQKDYGKVREPDLIAGPTSGRNNPDITAIAGSMNTFVTGDTRLEPARQPRDVRVHARFFGMLIKGKEIPQNTSSFGNSFGIAIFFDPK